MCRKLVVALLTIASVLLAGAGPGEVGPPRQPPGGNGDSDEVITRLTEAIRLTPGDAQAYRSRGDAWRDRSQLKKAVEDYSAALRLRPDDASLLAARGGAYVDAEEYPSAIADFTAAIGRDPRLAEAYFGRGVAYACIGPLDNALSDLNEALRLVPTLPGAHYYRGRVRHTTGQPELAITDFNRALELDPKHPDIYYDRARAWISKGNRAKAIDDFTEALRQNPRSAKAYIDRGAARFLEGQYDQAVADYNQAILLNPLDANAYFNRGLARAKDKGQYDQAIADYTEAIRLSPRMAEAYHGRGLAYRQEGQEEKAAQDLAKAEELKRASTHAVGRASPGAEVGKKATGPEFFIVEPTTELTQPSLIHILAHPDKYHDREVTVEGYLTIRFEGNAIYLSREHAEHRLATNGFSVSIFDFPFGLTRWELARQFHGKYVFLRGTFDRNSRGHRGGWSGGFKNITDLISRDGPVRRLPFQIPEDSSSPSLQEGRGAPFKPAAREPNRDGRKSLEFVPVGDPGNMADPRTGHGCVPYPYQIAKYPVTVAQYCEFLNAVAQTDTFELYEPQLTDGWPMAYAISRAGPPGNYRYAVTYRYAPAPDVENRPIHCVTWSNAVRFANWLSNGQPTGPQGPATTEDGSYALRATNSPAELMKVARKRCARYVLPTEDEWYKAAYYKGGSTNAGYWMYPTSSNGKPSRTQIPTKTNQANYFLKGADFFRGDVNNPRLGPTSVGLFALSPGPYGTFDQGGNVWEWLETAITPDTRGLRGGSFGGGSEYLAALYRDPGNGPCERHSVIGFRLVLLAPEN